MILRSLLALTTLSFLVTAQELLVSDYTGSVLRFDLVTGEPTGDLGAVPGAQSMRYGPDGHLYVCAEEDDAVLRFDGVSGAPLGRFVGDDPATPEDEGGGLDAPTAAAFLPNGDLAVASFTQDRVLRFDGTTGAFLGELIAAGTSPLNGPDAGMAVGPDGRLYVPSFNNNRILRYDLDGTFLDTFAPPAAGTLSRPRAIAWRGDGVAFVASWGNNRVLRYAPDGTFLGIFATTTRPSGLTFDPTTNDLLVTSDQVGQVLRFDGTSGTPKGTLVSATGGVIQAATYLALLPDPRLRMTRPDAETAGASTTLDITGATPGAPLLLAVGSLPASLPIGCPHLFVGFSDPVTAVLFADAAGEATPTGHVPLALAGVTLRLSTFEPSSCRLSNLVIVTFD